MSNINQTTLSGRLTRDCVTKTIGETEIIEFSIASSEKYKDKEQVIFMDCTIFGNRGKLPEFLTKGKFVVVTGKLKEDKWEKDGQKRSKVSIIVDNLDITG